MYRHGHRRDYFKPLVGCCLTAEVDIENHPCFWMLSRTGSALLSRCRALITRRERWYQAPQPSAGCATSTRAVGGAGLSLLAANPIRGHPESRRYKEAGQTSKATRTGSPSSIQYPSESSVEAESGPWPGWDHATLRAHVRCDGLPWRSPRASAADTRPPVFPQRAPATPILPKAHGLLQCIPLIGFAARPPNELNPKADAHSNDGRLTMPVV